MKTLFLIFLLTSLSVLHGEEENYTTEFYQDFDKIAAKYRKGFAEAILSADKVSIHLVKFDSGEKINSYPDLFDDTDDKIVISPYKSQVETISSKTLKEEDKAQFLKMFSSQISKDKHSGGAMCHYPIHGVKIYKDDQIIYQGTFCWVCHNFGIDYPIETDWLDTSKDLKEFFNKQLPIPKEELERFQKKYPIGKSKK